MILWRNIEKYHFYHFDSDPRFPQFLVYVRWKSRVNFVRRCFRDDQPSEHFLPQEWFSDGDRASAGDWNVPGSIQVQVSES